MNTTTEAAAAPAPYCIARDTYEGKWIVYKLKSGYGRRSWFAADIAKHAPEGIMWEWVDDSRLATRGFYTRTRYVADASGALHCYNSRGDKSIVHPGDRMLRIAVKF